MRYTNITDHERFMEKSLTFDDKFNRVYKYIWINLGALVKISQK